MKLYYSPGACSLAPHIVARELGIDLELVRVDLKAKSSPEGDFLEINPKGYVPALRLDDGQVLTEGPVISQYLADRKPESGFAPAPGTLERYRLQEMLGFINAEIHKTYGPLFAPNVTDEQRAATGDALRRRYALLDRQLEGRDYLFGERFGIADAYLFVVTGWSGFLKVDLARFANVQAFQARAAARPAVRAALAAEKG